MPCVTKISSIVKGILFKGLAYARLIAFNIAALVQASLKGNMAWPQLFFTRREQMMQIFASPG